jgi:glycosyltransferase involved in cell wall biosynthesis
VAFYPWHDQTTLWWFEQAVIALLAASGWENTWVTDAQYTFDDDRIVGLPGQLTLSYEQDTLDWQPPPGRYDAVLALFPSDRATRAARLLDVPLITFAIKNLHENEPPLQEAPPEGTPLWHAFAGSSNFLGAAYGPKDRPGSGKLGRTAPAWRLMGAPFPINRYYFPIRPAQPQFDALLFGSKGRDHDTALAALARAGAGSVAAIVNAPDVPHLEAAARRHGLRIHVSQNAPHLRLLELLEQSRLVLNPIMPPEESHYSLSVPLAVGRPIVATDRPCVVPFAGSGGLLAAAGDVDAWAAQIRRLLRETESGLPHAGAVQQGIERHDADRFFASAILATLDRPAHDLVAT